MELASMILKIEAATIRHGYRALQRTPSGELHAERYVRFQRYIQNHQDALLEVVFSGAITSDIALYGLIRLGGHGGSVAREHNEHWAPFIARVRERQSELPAFIARALDWQWDTHGW